MRKWQTYCPVIFKYFAKRLVEEYLLVLQEIHPIHAIKVVVLLSVTLHMLRHYTMLVMEKGNSRSTYI